MSLVGVTSMSTRGGDTVELRGTNMGPASSSSDTYTLTVRYTSPSGWRTFTASACAVTTAHTTMRCTSGEGSGAGHTWEASVGGQWTATGFTAASSVAYSSATVSGVFDNAQSARVVVTALSTVGGQSVRVMGSHMGPVGTPLVVHYQNRTGSAARWPAAMQLYTAASCAVVVAHDAAECTTVAGVGLGHEWRVTADGVAGTWSGSTGTASTTKYAAPVVSSVQVESGAATLRTAGGEVVVLHGSGFGPGSSVRMWAASASAAVSGSVGSAATLSLRAVEGLGVSGGSGAGESQSDAAHVVRAGVCTVTSDTEARCSSGWGVGTDHRWRVMVGGQVSA
ncbi:MAG: hypothetical protein Q8S55_23600, partial [Methylococcaceae bacterium]|nr:hypothetical protein [Methylococcaceae bacterium]